MEKTISSSCYDVIVIKHQNRSFRSTPFQVVFSTTILKQIQKNKLKQKVPPYKLLCYVNDRLVDGPMIVIDDNGRLMFKQVHHKRKAPTTVSDSSDHSDSDHSHKSQNFTIDSKSPTKGLKGKLHQYKNQKAPSSLWQFAWLFNNKKDEPPPPPPPPPQTTKKTIEQNQPDQSNQSNLTIIRQQVYEGEQHSKQPLFHLSLCGSLLKKISKKQQILKTFYDNRIQFNKFIKDPPRYLGDANLVLKIDDSIYTWQLGITILTCRFAYGRNLNKQQIEDLIKNKFSKKRLFSFLPFIYGQSNITKLDVQKFEQQDNLINKLQDCTNRYTLKYKKTKIPNTQIIKKMKLKYGKNICKFQLDLGQGFKKIVAMKIFLWDDQQKIVISDIDGTITKSDILGQILYKWFHAGVTKLYTQIYKRNYKIIYLTARAIGQYQQTSKFLQTIQQNKIHLPQGPLMMSPDGYMTSFMRQVYYKTTNSFKIQMLESIQQIFPCSINPMYCGFGNRDTDSAAYSKIQIDTNRIFCINDKSIISRQSDNQFKSNYVEMLTKINEFFPINSKQPPKDNQAMDSSNESQQDINYHTVTLQKVSLKKARSVGGQPSMQDFQFIQQYDSLSSTLSRKRKSEHQIPIDDIHGFEQFIQNKKLIKKQNKKNIKQQLLQINKISNNNNNFIILTQPNTNKINLQQKLININQQNIQFNQKSKNLQINQLKQQIIKQPSIEKETIKNQSQNIQQQHKNQNIKQQQQHKKQQIQIKQQQKQQQKKIEVVETFKLDTLNNDKSQNQKQKIIQVIPQIVHQNPPQQKQTQKSEHELQLQLQIKQKTQIKQDSKQNTPTNN